MRGCLKHHSPSSSPPTSSSIATPPPTRTPTPPLIPPNAPSLAVKRRPPPTLTDDCLSRRCVHFCSELVDKIFVADEWDRSPAEVTPRLTYEEILELKAIQRSLPHAAQPPDDPDLPELDVRGIPRTHFLQAVPVGLVPLISPATSPISRPNLVKTPPFVMPPSKVVSPPCQSLPSRPPPSPPSTPPPHIVVTNPPYREARKPPEPPSPARAVQPWVPPPPPPRLPYNIPIQPRPVPRFHFLPLLETPAPPAASALSNSTQAPEQCPPPPLPASLVPPHLQTSPSRTPSPRDETIGPSPSSSISQSCHHFGPTESLLPHPSIDRPLSAAVTPTISDRPSSPLASQLLPPSSLSCSPPSPGDTKDTSSEDALLGAELTQLWHSHSCNTDGETEAEESEAESSVVHTEADSDGESARAVVAFAKKRAPVAVTTAADVDDDEGEMSLVELEGGVMTFVRTPRRRR